MSMHDPIADMLTRIRNGQQANHRSVTLNSSKLKEEIARVLKEEGYILDYRIDLSENNIKVMTVDLKYYQGRPVIERIARISRPGLRVYKSFKKLHSIAARLGCVGGEVICEVA